LYVHFVTKVNLQFEIYAKNGFLISEMTHFEKKIATLIKAQLVVLRSRIILMRLRLQVKILMRLLFITYHSTKFVIFFKMRFGVGAIGAVAASRCGSIKMMRLLVAPKH
jgi:hypothetical protein